MKYLSTTLALVVTAFMSGTLAGAPIPTAPADGPRSIGDILRMRDKVPMSAPPAVSRVAMRENMIEVEVQVLTYHQVVKEAAIERDGRVEKVQIVETVPVPQATKTRMKVADCKFFAVTKDGKLEVIEADKASGMLKKETPVLIGYRADLDPRHLELVKAGTMYIALPMNDARLVPQATDPIAPPGLVPPPDARQ